LPLCQQLHDTEHHPLGHVEWGGFFG